MSAERKQQQRQPSYPRNETLRVALVQAIANARAEREDRERRERAAREEAKRRVDAAAAEQKEREKKEEEAAAEKARSILIPNPLLCLELCGPMAGSLSWA